MTSNEQRSQHTEFGGGSGDDRTRSDGTLRPLTGQERAIAARRAAIREEPLPEGITPGRRIS